MTLKIFVSASVAALMLVGCMSTGADFVDPAPLTATQRYSLQVEPGLDRIALAVHETGLSPNQQGALSSLVGRFAAEGGDVILVQSPGGNDPVASALAWSVKDTVERMGLPGRVQVVSYDAPDPRAPVLVSYETVHAVVPQCGTRWSGSSNNFANTSSPNFGCAVTANLAAQIANPRDIVTPRSMTPSDAGRRAVVFDNYRKGEATAATQEDLLRNRRISQAVN